MTYRAIARFVAPLVLIGSAVGCRSRGERPPSDQRLAAIASESLTTAIADSVAPLHGFALAGEAVDFLSACDNRVDAAGWQTFGSSIIELELPSGFAPTGGDQQATWRSPDGWISASGSSPSGHGEHRGPEGSECDVYIGGWPAHVELSSTDYGKSIRVIIQTPGDQWINVSAGARTTTRQAQLLRAIRYARISSAWGR
jgi:hypothetical protein